MNARPPRSLLPFTLALGLVWGCTHPSGTAPSPADTTARARPSGGRIVTSEDIDRSPGRPIEQILEEHFPGVMVTRLPDGSISIRMRGTTSFLASTEPLYVLDGLPILPGPSGGLTGINPYDIASIEVLKDAASTAMYGMRGANGVVVIKTKRPPQ